MITEPKQDDIDRAFRNTNFGPLGETPEGRRYLVAECIMKRACGFSSGHTIEVICKHLKLLTKSGTPKINAKHWAYCYIIDKLAQREANTSKQAAGEAVACSSPMQQGLDRRVRGGLRGMIVPMLPALEDTPAGALAEIALADRIIDTVLAFSGRTPSPVDGGVEERARELLASHSDARGLHSFADDLREQIVTDEYTAASLDAIAAALRTQPKTGGDVGHYCNPVAFFNGAACPECVNKHYLPQQEARALDDEMARDAARYRKIRLGRSDWHGDVYAMTFHADGDYPLSGDALDMQVDRMRHASAEPENKP